MDTDDTISLLSSVDGQQTFAGYTDLNSFLKTKHRNLTQKYKELQSNPKHDAIPTLFKFLHEDEDFKDNAKIYQYFLKLFHAMIQGRNQTILNTFHTILNVKYDEMIKTVVLKNHMYGSLDGMETYYKTTVQVLTYDQFAISDKIKETLIQLYKKMFIFTYAYLIYDEVNKYENKENYENPIVDKKSLIFTHFLNKITSNEYNINDYIVLTTGLHEDDKAFNIVIPDNILNDIGIFKSNSEYISFLHHIVDPTIPSKPDNNDDNDDNDDNDLYNMQAKTIIDGLYLYKLLFCIAKTKDVIIENIENYKTECEKSPLTNSSYSYRKFVDNGNYDTVLNRYMNEQKKRQEEAKEEEKRQIESYARFIKQKEPIEARVRELKERNLVRDVERDLKGSEDLTKKEKLIGLIKKYKAIVENNSYIVTVLSDVIRMYVNADEQLRIKEEQERELQAVEDAKLKEARAKQEEDRLTEEKKENERLAAEKTQKEMQEQQAQYDALQMALRNKRTFIRGKQRELDDFVLYSKDYKKYQNSLVQLQSFFNKLNIADNPLSYITEFVQDRDIELFFDKGVIIGQAHETVIEALSNAYYAKSKMPTQQLIPVDMNLLSGKDKIDFNEWYRILDNKYNITAEERELQNKPTTPTFHFVYDKLKDMGMEEGVIRRILICIAQYDLKSMIKYSPLLTVFLDRTVKNFNVKENQVIINSPDEAKKIYIKIKSHLFTNNRLIQGTMYMHRSQLHRKLVDIASNYLEKYCNTMIKIEGLSPMLAMPLDTNIVRMLLKVIKIISVGEGDQTEDKKVMKQFQSLYAVENGIYIPHESKIFENVGLMKLLMINDNNYQNYNTDALKFMLNELFNYEDGNNTKIFPPSTKENLAYDRNIAEFIKDLVPVQWKSGVSNKQVERYLTPLVRDYAVTTRLQKKLERVTFQTNSVAIKVKEYITILYGSISAIAKQISNDDISGLLARLAAIKDSDINISNCASVLAEANALARIINYHIVIYSAVDNAYKAVFNVSDKVKDGEALYNVASTLQDLVNQLASDGKNGTILERLRKEIENKDVLYIYQQKEHLDMVEISLTEIKRKIVLTADSEQKTAFLEEIERIRYIHGKLKESLEKDDNLKEYSALAAKTQLKEQYAQLLTAADAYNRSEQERKQEETQKITALEELYNSNLSSLSKEQQKVIKAAIYTFKKRVGLLKQQELLPIDVTHEDITNLDESGINVEDTITSLNHMINEGILPMITDYIDGMLTALPSEMNVAASYKQDIESVKEAANESIGKAISTLKDLIKPLGQDIIEQGTMTMPEYTEYLLKLFSITIMHRVIDDNVTPVQLKYVAVLQAYVEEFVKQVENQQTFVLQQPNWVDNNTFNVDLEHPDPRDNPTFSTNNLITQDFYNKHIKDIGFETEKLEKAVEQNKESGDNRTLIEATQAFVKECETNINIYKPSSESTPKFSNISDMDDVYIVIQLYTHHKTIYESVLKAEEARKAAEAAEAEAAEAELYIHHKTIHDEQQKILTIRDTVISTQSLEQSRAEFEKLYAVMTDYKQIAQDMIDHEDYIQTIYRNPFYYTDVWKPYIKDCKDFVKKCNDNSMLQNVHVSSSDYVTMNEIIQLLNNAFETNQFHFCVNTHTVFAKVFESLKDIKECEDLDPLYSVTNTKQKLESMLKENNNRKSNCTFDDIQTFFGLYHTLKLYQDLCKNYSNIKNAEKAATELLAVQTKEMGKLRDDIGKIHLITPSSDKDINKLVENYNSTVTNLQADSQSTDKTPEQLQEILEKLQEAKEILDKAVKEVLKKKVDELPSGVDESKAKIIEQINDASGSELEDIDSILTQIQELANKAKKEASAKLQEYIKEPDKFSVIYLELIETTQEVKDGFVYTDNELTPLGKAYYNAVARVYELAIARLLPKHDDNRQTIVYTQTRDKKLSYQLNDNNTKIVGDLKTFSKEDLVQIAGKARVVMEMFVGILDNSKDYYSKILEAVQPLAKEVLG
jgi:hypothetical protein